MFDQYRIQVDYKPRQQQLLNALLALATGILTLVYPNFLYLIAAGYLVALGLLFMAFRIPPVLSAIPIVTGVIIFIFPKLIPITLAAFLGLFGFMLLFGFQFAIVGIITLVIAILILMNPDSVAYLIATFLLIYSVSNLIRFYRNWKSRESGSPTTL